MESGMAQRIKELRQERGMTLEQVADIVGVGKSTVRKWETGRHGDTYSYYVCYKKKKKGA